MGTLRKEKQWRKEERTAQRGAARSASLPRSGVAETAAVAQDKSAPVVQQR